MKLSEMNNQYVFFTLINLDEDGANFVKLRELTTGELDKLNRADENDRVSVLEKLFPVCLVDHSFTKNDDDTEKASGEEVYRELLKSGSLFIDIITIWMNSIPLSKRLKKEPK
jgi:hypothetical protein